MEQESNKARKHSVEFRIEIAQRMLAGESSMALSQEYQLARSMMYRWRDVYRKRGAASRPTQGQAEGRSNAGAAAAGPHRRTRAQGRATDSGNRFFQSSLQASRRVAQSPTAWRHSVYAEVQRRTQLEDKRLTVDRACQLAGVTRAGFYRCWQEHEPKQVEVELRSRMQQICLDHPLFGTRQVTAALREEGCLVNRKRVQRLMRLDNLLALRRRRYVITTEARHTYAVYPNLAGDFQPTQANQLWVADITYIRLREMFVYLAVILDAWSRRVIGWSVGEALECELALAALRQALADRVVPVGIIHHSDRGVQYCARAYVELLESAGFRISMSRAGNPYDNALAESFMRTVKCEEVYLHSYRDVDDVRLRVGEFLEDYNHRRRHSALGYRSPVAFEKAQA